MDKNGRKNCSGAEAQAAKKCQDGKEGLVGMAHLLGVTVDMTKTMHTKIFSGKILFKVHGWLGLNIGLLLFVICFSGTFATLSNELDWLLDPAVRVKGKDAPVAWEAMYQNLREAFPDGQAYLLHEQKNPFTEVGDYFAAAAVVVTPAGETMKVHFDPYTGALKGHNPFLDVQRFFRSYHNLFFDGRRGVYIVTVFSIFLLCSVLTGFLFYKNWLKNLFTMRLGKGPRVLFADAHRMAGIWSLLFALIIALTGIWYLVETVVADSGSSFETVGPDKIEKAALKGLGHTPTLISLDTLVRNAELAFPGYRVEQIRLPFEPDDYVVMDGQDGNPFTRDRTNKVYANPFTGEVVHIQRASDLSAAQLINNIVDTLHFGTFAGLGIKILWFAFGLVLSFSILAGTYLWYLRHTRKLESQISKKRSMRRHEQEKHATAVTAAGFSWKNIGLGRGAIISTIIILIYLISTGIATVTDGFRIWSGYPEGYTATIDTAILGPWQVDLQCTYPCTLEEGTQLTARFRTSGMPNYDSLYLSFFTAGVDTLNTPFNGTAALPRLIIDESVANAGVTGISLEASNYDGIQWHQKIDLTKLHAVAEKMQQRFPVAPEPTYPKVPVHVYIVAGIFGLLTASILLIWTTLLIRASRREQKLLALAN